ncbi:MAG: element excision factor XisI family protein [Chloroflexota bacterium]
MDSKTIDILRAEMAKYGGEGLNCISYIAENLDAMVFTSTTMFTGKQDPKPLMDLFVRVIADKIVIEVDKNSKPLVDALVQAGIPREQIILAYIGEKVPETLI